MTLNRAEFKEYVKTLGFSESEENVLRKERKSIFGNSNVLDANGDFQSNSVLSDYISSLNVPREFNTSVQFIYNYFEADESINFPVDSFNETIQNILNGLTLLFLAL